MSAVGVGVRGVEDLFLVRAGDDQVTSLKEHWVPYYLGRKALEPTWTWRPFPWVEIITTLPTFAAVDGTSSLEGLIALSKAEDAIKVAFVATAPWNHGPQRHRRGIGPSLLRVAIETSKHLKFGGALVLSSTPESETFYVEKGFTRTGEKDHEGLAIFRLPPEAAEEFLVKTPGLQPWPEEPESGEEPTGEEP